MPVSVGPVLTLTTSEEVCEALRESLQIGEAAVIDCAEIVEADVSLLQLIVAARAQASRDEGRVTLRGTANPVFSGLLARAGCAGDPMFAEGDGSAREHHA